MPAASSECEALKEINTMGYIVYVFTQQNEANPPPTTYLQAYRKNETKAPLRDTYAYVEHPITNPQAVRNALYRLIHELHETDGWKGL